MLINNYFMKKLTVNSIDNFCTNCKNLYNIFVVIIEDSIGNYSSLDL